MLDHVSLTVADLAAAEASWQAGLGHGGTDEGAQGLRPTYHPSYDAAFLADPSDNRIEAVCHGRADP